MGATVTRRQRLSADAPLLYQEHWIDGGEGGLTLAHHPMVRLEGRGRFFTSPKRAILTPDRPLDPGRNRLACGQVQPGDDLRLPAAGGGTVDLSDLPIGESHEDFVTLVEAASCRLGWSAVLREVEDDIVFVLKDPRVLPVTMLWHSNGGRDYAPWNGRHRGVLGIEDGCAAGAAGHRAALGPNPISAQGVATTLALAKDTRHRIAHVIGAVARPAGWDDIADIAVEGERLALSTSAGQSRSLAFRAGFFEET